MTKCYACDEESPESALEHMRRAHPDWFEAPDTDERNEQL